ncbi:OmpA family protein [Marinobacterium jannaschii]|uniref:OmpA family protein n=1 Tax=Marinobacterium jannaschii TaxID=64970 RepID=UPI00048A14B0|nr:OmpA family protein [Marinobacterium jannaschii]
MKLLAKATGLALAIGLAAGVQAHPNHAGYATDSNENIVRTGFGECWRVGTWTESSVQNAVEGCDGYQKPQPKPAPAPAPKPVVKVQPAPAPVPAPAPAPKFVDMPVQQSHIVYFGFDSAEVNQIDEIVNYLSSLDNLEQIRLVGHADRLGASEYNIKLSERRMRSVTELLEDAGVAPGKISTGFRGENAPATTCSGSGEQLKKCLASNRRVEVVINGVKRVQQ